MWGHGQHDKLLSLMLVQWVSQSVMDIFVDVAMDGTGKPKYSFSLIYFIDVLPIGLEW